MPRKRVPENSVAPFYGEQTGAERTLQEGRLDAAPQAAVDEKRRALLHRINTDPKEREDLESRYGKVWNTQELAGPWFRGALRSRAS